MGHRTMLTSLTAEYSLPDSFTKDLDTIDTTLPFSLRALLSNVAMFFGTLVVTSYGTPSFVLPVLIIMVLAIRAQVSAYIHVYVHVHTSGVPRGVGRGGHGPRAQALEEAPAQLVGANFKKKIRPRQISKVTSLQCRINLAAKVGPPAMGHALPMGVFRGSFLYFSC